MERLTSSSSSRLGGSSGGVKLRGTVEAVEFYIKAGLKGRSYHLEILNSGRLPRRRGLKRWKEEVLMKHTSNENMYTSKRRNDIF
jgi:hypothetical protein